jgi:hypothetical protein
MSGYTSLGDMPFCPSTEDGKHDWLDRRMYDSNEPYKAECSACAALVDHLWWGWQFQTGLEHFADAQHDPAVQALMAEIQENDRRRRRGGYITREDAQRALAQVPRNVNVENY